MKTGAIPQTPLEAIALAANAIPVPMAETHSGPMLARAIMAATRIGLFDRLAGGPLDLEELATRCGSDVCATAALATALVGAGYLTYRRGCFALTRRSRKWLLASSPSSVRDFILFRYVEWEWMSKLDDYLASGEPIDFHRAMTPQQWRAYQRGMRAAAIPTVGEFVRKFPVPSSGARAMLDIGGSHGLYAAALCRRLPALRVEIVELPEAIPFASEIAASERMGDRITYRAGDARTLELGEEAYDIILISNLAHHLSNDENRSLCARAARALRPGGVLAVNEILVRPPSPERGNPLGAILGLYFSLTSRAGTYAVEEIADWLRGAGLQLRHPVRFLTIPGGALVAGSKPPHKAA